MIGAPAIIMPVDIKGFIQGYHYCAKTGLWTKAFDGENAVSGELKAIIRDNFNAPTDFAMDSLFATDGQQWGDTGHEAGNPAGGDGMLANDTTNNKYLTLVTTALSSGSFYQVWQGVLTNDYGAGSIVIGGDSNTHMFMGTNLTSVSGFQYDYASRDIVSGITLAANDIFTVTWQITSG